jgi:hypothetical protein
MPPTAKPEARTAASIPPENEAARSSLTRRGEGPLSMCYSAVPMVPPTERRSAASRPSPFPSPQQGSTIVPFWTTLVAPFVAGVLQIMRNSRRLWPNSPAEVLLPWPVL